MIEFTANVISEDEPLFVPNHVSLWQPENVEGGYIVGVWASNAMHAEATIVAMFPRCVIDDGPHEVFPEDGAPVWWGGIEWQPSVTVPIPDRPCRPGVGCPCETLRRDVVDVETATGGTVQAERVRPAAFGPHLPPPPSGSPSRDVDPAHNTEFPVDFSFCPICGAQLLLNNAVTGEKFCPEGVAEEDCGDCRRPIFYNYDDEAWHHAVDPGTGCFLIPPDPRSVVGFQPPDWSGD